VIVTSASFNRVNARRAPDRFFFANSLWRATPFISSVAEATSQATAKETSDGQTDRRRMA
ncbi:MAG: hypothetical protein AAFP78_02365, partial [Pseudomonadota bacterium]